MQCLYAPDFCLTFIASVKLSKEKCFTSGLWDARRRFSPWNIVGGNIMEEPAIHVIHILYIILL